MLTNIVAGDTVAINDLAIQVTALLILGFLLFTKVSLLFLGFLLFTKVSLQLLELICLLLLFDDSEA